MSVTTATFNLPVSSCPLHMADDRAQSYCCRSVAEPVGGNATEEADKNDRSCVGMSVLGLYMCQNIDTIKNTTTALWEPKEDEVTKGCSGPAPASGEKVVVTIGGAHCTAANAGRDEGENFWKDSVGPCCKIAGGKLGDDGFSCSEATADYFTWCVKSSSIYAHEPNVTCTAGSSTNSTASSTTKNGTDPLTNGTNTNGNASAATTSSGSRSTVAKLGFAVYALLALQALL